MNAKTLRLIAFVLFILSAVWNILSLSRIGWLPKSPLASIALLIAFALLLLAHKREARR